VQRLLVHRAGGDGVERAALAAAVVFEAALDQADDSGLAAADRPHEQEDALADLEPLGRRVEVFYDLLQGSIETVDFLVEEVITGFAALADLCAVGHDHVEDAGVRELRGLRVLLNDLKIIGKRALPGKSLFLGTKLFKFADQIHRDLLSRCCPAACACR